MRGAWGRWRLWQTNELVVSLNVFISHPADKQSPGAGQPPTSHPYRQLRTLNKEETLQGRDTPAPKRETHSRGHFWKHYNTKEWRLQGGLLLVGTPQ